MIASSVSLQGSGPLDVPNLRTVRSDVIFASISHPREHCTMGDKSPKKDNAKKPAKTIKEKRAAKQEKRHPTDRFGTS